jgi:hypothetical protein
LIFNILRVLCFSHGLVGHRTRENAVDFHFPLVVMYYDVDYVKNAKSSNYWRNRYVRAFLMQQFPLITLHIFTLWGTYFHEAVL